MSTQTKLWKMNSHFELLTRKLNFEISTFELITQKWEIKSFTSSYHLEAKKQKISLRVSDSTLKNKKFHFELLIW